MKIRLMFDLDRRTREAIAHHRGGILAASHAECKALLEGLLSADLQVIVSEYDEADACENCGCHEHLPKPCDTCECSAVEERE